jgi:hypothetical protein
MYYSMPAMWTDPLDKYPDYAIWHIQSQQLNNQHFLHAIVDPVTLTWDYEKQTLDISM